jgi:hypothetical protein
MKPFVIFLGCNIKQYVYLKRIYLLGYPIILIDKNKNSLGKKLSFKFFKCSYTDKIELFKIYKIIKQFKILGIFSASSHFAHIGGAYLAKKLDIKYPSEKNISICMNKCLFYPFFKKNNISIPKTRYVKNRTELRKILSKLDNKKKFYLKSDFSKNPHYVYSGTAQALLNKKINWKKNQFLKKKYILQKEFLGKHLRVNTYNKKYEVYDFFNGKKILVNKYSEFEKFHIIKRLFKIQKILEMTNWLLKFDLVLNKDSYALLDIGLSPPHRMKIFWEKNNKDFIKFYLRLFLKKI